MFTISPLNYEKICKFGINDIFSVSNAKFNYNLWVKLGSKEIIWAIEQNEVKFQVTNTRSFVIFFRSEFSRIYIRKKKIWKFSDTFKVGFPSFLSTNTVENTSFECFSSRPQIIIRWAKCPPFFVLFLEILAIFECVTDCVVCDASGHSLCSRMDVFTSHTTTGPKGGKGGK